MDAEEHKTTAQLSMSELVAHSGWPVSRARRQHVEADRDRQWLRWIGRFRFVTAELLSMRFGVSVQQARNRVRRLARDGLVMAVRAHVSEAQAIYLTAKGAVAIGRRPRRKPPRVALQREHELAIVDLVARLELDATAADIEILTERDCRGLEADGVAHYSVAVLDDRGRASRRWPDVVVCQGDSRMAIEIEFAAKAASRLASILAGYLSSELDEVRYLVASPGLASRLLKVMALERGRLAAQRETPRTRVTVDAWHGAPDETRAEIARRIAPSD